MLCFPGFGERFRGVSGFVPDFAPEMLDRTRGTASRLGQKKLSLSTGCPSGGRF